MVTESTGRLMMVIASISLESSSDATAKDETASNSAKIDKVDFKLISPTFTGIWDGM